MDPVPPIPIDPASGNRLLEALAGAAGPRAAGGSNREEMIQAAKDFESVLLDRLFQEMKRTIPDSGLLGGPGSGQVWDLFWSQLARDVANRGGMGLWKQMLGQIGAAARADPPESPGAAETESKP